MSDLPQIEADELLAMPKVKVDANEHQFPPGNQSVSIPLASEDRRERFLLDVESGRINFRKLKLQNRARQSIVLCRLDICGPPHRNPDGAEIPCPHLHVYRETYGVKWAIEPPPDRFSNLLDHWIALADFMRYCAIVDPPLFERGLLP